ncbi:DNRLRE domain-containing protein, partial [Clostridium perfringens]|nr:DNRLRE domain-containing protein [Clostridium perfringens]
VTAPAVQVEIQASADATIDSLNPSTNFGAEPSLTVGHSARPPGEQRILLRFDLNGVLPAGAVIDAAQLHLFLAAFTGAGTVALTPYLLTSPWEE